MTPQEIKKHQAGMNGPDGWYHREMLEIRRTALHQDEPTFGLTLAEQLELSVLDMALDAAPSNPRGKL